MTSTVLGQIGTVSSRIPAEGLGEVKLRVRGTSEAFSACSEHGVEIPFGTRIVVTEQASPTVVRVEPFG